MTLPERMVEAAGLAVEAQMATDDNMPEDIARAALTAALAVAVAEGVVLCKVPEERRFLWRVTFADPR
jgi:hypothetical protein